jgi:phage portal protein BeeE
MTQSDLIEKVIWQLFFNSNAYIYPAYDLYRDGYGNTVRKYTALYPLNPAQPPTFLYDAINGTFAVQMNLGGDMFTLPYADLIHIRLKYSLNDILGGNAMGHMETASLKALLHTSADTMTGLAKSALTAGAINGVVYANGLLGKDKMKGEIEKFNQQLNDPAFSGLLQLDQGSSAQQWSRAAKMVDVDTLKYLDEKILRWFGVSLPIISGDYTPAQFEAFHNSVLEPLIVSFSQAFTRVLFTPREQSFGNRITLQSNELLFMTRSEINTLVATAAPMGIFYDNEIRGFYGLPPIPELEGVRHQSLNYIDTKLAPFYQSGAQGQGESNG